MRLLNMKISFKCKFIIIGIISIISVIVVVANKNSDKEIASMQNTYDSKSDELTCVTFLSKFGWEVEEIPVEIREVTIPCEFNNTYEKYNEIQISQKFNFKKYKGKVCRRLTYQVLNYKDNPDSVRANLLIYKGKIIAGDICSVEFNGFMHGIDAKENQL